MAEDIIKGGEEETVETEIVTLTDENGVESEFEILLTLDIEGTTYYALIPVEEDEDEEGTYVILKAAKEEGEDVFVTIDDDDEFEKVSEIFDDALFSEIDHDEE